jgi:hypothetical protein
MTTHSPSPSGRGWGRGTFEGLTEAPSVSVLEARWNHFFGC